MEDRANFEFIFPVEGMEQLDTTCIWEIIHLLYKI